MDKTLPPGYMLRHPQMDDLEALNDLITACALAEDGTDAFAEPWQRSDWASPTFHMATDAWVVSASNGQIVGFATIRPRAMGHFRIAVYVHPQQQGQGTGKQLLQVSETRARQIAQPLPADLPIALVQKISSANTAAKQLLAQNGYRPIYHNWQMVIDLGEAPPAPIWPAGITVRPCIPGQDERTVYAVTTEAFAELVTFDEWATVRLQPKKFQPDLWFLASAGAEIAGVVLSCYMREMGWVGILAVRKKWRKQGLGMALLRHAFGEFYRRGTRQVGLSVDSQNTSGATRLYERAGMRIARQDDRYQKILRPARS